MKLYADIAKHGCEPREFYSQVACFLPSFGPLARMYHFGVTSWIANRNWPITHQDYAHVGGYREEIDPDSPNYAYVNCGSPIPTIANIDIHQSVGSGYTITWDNQAGCVADIVIDRMKLCLTFHYGGGQYKRKCVTNVNETATSMWLSLGEGFNDIKALSAVTVEVDRYPREQDRTSGGHSYNTKYTDVPVRYQ